MEACLVSVGAFTKTGFFYTHFFMEAKVSGKTKVVLYGDSYIKFIIKYACSEVGLDCEQKETTAKVLTDEVCLAGELNDTESQKKLVNNGCFSLLDLV